MHVGNLETSLHLEAFHPNTSAKSLLPCKVPPSQGPVVGTQTFGAGGVCGHLHTTAYANRRFVPQIPFISLKCLVHSVEPGASWVHPSWEDNAVEAAPVSITAKVSASWDGRGAGLSDGSSLESPANSNTRDNAEHCIALYGLQSTFKDVLQVGSMQLVRPLLQKGKLGLRMGRGLPSVPDGFVTRTQHFSSVVQGSVQPGSVQRWQ